MNPKISFQRVDDERVLVSMEHTSPDGERIAFSVLMQSDPRQPTGRTVPEHAVEACNQAQQHLDALLQACVADAVASRPHQG
jgi:hypothetical protein